MLTFAKLRSRLRKRVIRLIPEITQLPRHEIESLMDGFTSDYSWENTGEMMISTHRLPPEKQISLIQRTGLTPYMPISADLLAFYRKRAIEGRPEAVDIFEIATDWSMPCPESRVPQ